MDSLTMHPCLLDYCKVNYQFVYDPSYYVMGIFANFVNKDGHIITNRQPVNPVFCAKVIRSLYSETIANNTIVKSMVRTAGNTIVRSLLGALGLGGGSSRSKKSSWF